MKNFNKYKKGYFMPPVKSLKWVEKDAIEKAPIWCSVDLRDGNQALVVPIIKTDYAIVDAKSTEKAKQIFIASFPM